MATLDEVEGIGPAYAAKLADAGVRTTDDLLAAGATPDGREALAEKAGIAPSLVLEWVNHADLFRIEGVGSEYADLLEAAGVDTVVELSHRNPSNLTSALAELNERKHLVRRVPTQAQLARWIEEAKGLERAVHH